MTCIVGWVEGNKVWLGGDSAGGDTDTYGLAVLKQPKVFVNGPMVMGYTSSFRMGQLLQHALTVPAQAEGQAIETYMATTFADAVRSCVRTAGWSMVANAQESGGDFLVGYRGRLFYVDAHFGVLEAATPYQAIGCGYSAAKGALFATTTFRGAGALTPRDRLELALQAAEAFNAYVCGPFTFVSI